MVEIDTETKIMNLVKHFGFIRRNNLFNRLNEDLQSEDIESDSKNSELSYSRPFELFEKQEKVKQTKSTNRAKKPKTRQTKASLVTFNRLMKRLIKLNKLKNVKYPEYRRLGIPDKDRKASYITLYATYDLIRHYDNVLEQVKSDDSLKKKNALIEIESMMSDVVFTPEQLTKLSDLLSEKEHMFDKEHKLGENIIRILYHSVDKKKLFPSNSEKFQENIIAYYNRNEGRIEPNTKAHIIHLLGLFNNEIVIDFLKKDINYGRDEEALKTEGYYTWSIAKLIDENKEKLFEFQGTLDKEQKSLNVFKVRTNAKHLLSTYERIYPEYERKLEELQ